MKSTFRLLRRKFLEEGKLQRYLGYALGEVILITVGILIALQISDWNENRKNSIRENLQLKLILSDLEQSEEDQERVIQSYERTISKMQIAERMLYEKTITEGNIEQFTMYFEMLYGWPGYPVTTDAIDELKESGDFTLISDRALRMEFSHYLKTMEIIYLAQENLGDTFMAHNHEFDRFLRWSLNDSDGKRIIEMTPSDLQDNKQFYNSVNAICRGQEVLLSMFQEGLKDTQKLKQILEKYLSINTQQVGGGDAIR